MSKREDSEAIVRRLRDSGLGVSSSQKLQKDLDKLPADSLRALRDGLGLFYETTKHAVEVVERTRGIGRFVEGES